MRLTATALLALGGETVGAVATHFLPPGMPGFEQAGGAAGTGADYLAAPSGDLAVAYQWLLSDLGLEEVSLVGLGFGGWIAAEMATMTPRGPHCRPDNSASPRPPPWPSSTTIPSPSSDSSRRPGSPTPRR